MIPGEYFLLNKPVTCNEGKPVTSIVVVNTGDRPIQVGSHFHFFEVNRMMEFDRGKAYGHRLDIASGTAVRFEPGEEKKVSIIPFGGNQKISGFSNLMKGEIQAANHKRLAMSLLATQNFKNKIS